MGQVVSKEIGANAEELNSRYDAVLTAYVIQSEKLGAGTTYPIVIRRGDTHGLMVDTSALRPVTDGNMSLGLAAGDTDGPKRFTDVNAVLLQGADFVFENGYRLTEANHVYKDMEPGDGIFLMDPNWKPVWFVDRRGNLHVTGKVIPDAVWSEPDVPRREKEDVARSEKE